MSKWQKHKSKWADCTNCELCETRTHTVLYRGKIPCDVLLIGEAPGASENLLNKPFVGPAGILLDKFVTESGLTHFKLGFTNLVCCIPLDPDGNKVSDPDKEHIEACADRLVEMVNIAHPYGIVAVGKHAKTWIPKLMEWDGFITDITHPGAILRADVTQKELQCQQAIIRLADFVEELCDALED